MARIEITDQQAAFLWRAVLVRAIQDATLPKKRYHNRWIDPYEKRLAIQFLTDQDGVWARRRAEICDYLHICPERLRKGVLDKVIRIDNAKRKPMNIEKLFYFVEKPC